MRDSVTETIERSKVGDVYFMQLQMKECHIFVCLIQMYLNMLLGLIKYTHLNICKELFWLVHMLDQLCLVQTFQQELTCDPGQQN